MTFNILQGLGEVAEFRLSLRAETDRGCALMAGAFLDDQLVLLLRKVLVDEKALVDTLFDFSSSLGTFSARIDMCYALGIIPRDARRDLHLIRKIRNDFGHVARPLTFDDSRISSRCRELTYVTRHGGTTRDLFTSAALGVCAIIHAATEESKHAEPASSVFSEVDANKLRDDIENMVKSLMSSLREDGGAVANT